MPVWGFCVLYDGEKDLVNPTVFEVGYCTRNKAGYGHYVKGMLAISKSVTCFIVGSVFLFQFFIIKINEILMKLLVKLVRLWLNFFQA